MNGSKRAFTLIELLVVLLILGAIAKWTPAGIREQIYVATLKTDLASLSVAEDAYFAEHGTYTTTLTVGQYNASQSVNVTILSVSTGGWSATATHNLTSTACTIALGASAPPGGSLVCK